MEKANAKEIYIYIISHCLSVGLCNEIANGVYQLLIFEVKRENSV